MQKLTLTIPVLVEGKYDKIRLASVMDGTILTTEGFGIFNSAERLALIRRLAEPQGILVLTDSDGAGRVIRSFISSALPKDKIKPIYIPKIKGKERRKAHGSKEGTLGVEGMDSELLRTLLAPFAVNAPARPTGGITKADFFAWGLTGTDNASENRATLCHRLALPEMNATPLLSALNLIYAREEILQTLSEIGLL